MEMDSREEDGYSADEYNECEQQYWENEDEGKISSVQLTESNSACIVVEENESRDESHGNKLSELEQQVEVAEARCGTLQQQLEFMRLLYKDKFDEYSSLETCSDSDGALKSPHRCELPNDSTLLPHPTSKDLIGSSDQEKSSSLLSDMSGLFFSAQQNFVAIINNENSPISSGSENQTQLYDIESFEQNFELHNNQTPENISGLENMPQEYAGNIVHDLQLEDLHLKDDEKDHIPKEEEDLENRCELQSNCLVENSSMHENDGEIDYYFPNEKCESTANYELEDYCDNEANSNIGTNYNYDNSCEFISYGDSENYEEPEKASEKTLNTEELTSFFSNDEKYFDSEGYDLNENLEMTKHEENNPCSSTSEQNKPSYLAKNTSNAKVFENDELNDKYKSDLLHESSYHNSISMNKYETPISNEETFKNGKINPVKTIKGILNGLASSVNIISQLGENSSEIMRRKHKKHSKRVSNVASRISINTRTSLPSTESESGRKQCSNYEFADYSLKTKKSCNSGRSHLLIKHKEPTTADDLSVKTMVKLIQENGSQLSVPHSTDRLSYHYSNGHRRHHHRHRHRHYHGENELEEQTTSLLKGKAISSNTDIHIKHERDIADTFSLKHKPVHHKADRLYDGLNYKSNESLIAHSVTKKTHKKARSRRKHCEMEEKNWNDEKQNISLKVIDNSTKFQHDCDNISVKTLTRKRHKKYQGSETLMVDNIEESYIREDSHNLNVNTKTLHQNENRTQEAKITEEQLSNKNNVFPQPKPKSTEKPTKTDKIEKYKQVSNSKSENLPDLSSIDPLTKTKCVNEPYCCEVTTPYDPTPNFAIPTISSRLKQNEKPILQFFNFRNIPFVVGTSTSRSHNLALNLQQALSIMKLRNLPGVIGDLATEVGSSLLSHQSRPSTVGSTTGHKEFCPVAMAQMRSVRNQLTENNHEIVMQEEKIDTNHNSESDPLPGTFESLLKTQSETVNVGGVCFPQLKQKGNVWDVDQTDENSNYSKLRCTCFPTRPCIDYQKLLCEYISTGEETTFLHMLLKSQDKREIQQRTRSGISAFENGHHDISTTKEVVEFGDDNGENPVYGQIQAHSKGLKEVLLNMHRDFLRLSSKYECLQAEVSHLGDNGLEASKELAKLEAELETKEDDIMVVMGLYKELTSLKQQVKALRAKTSSQNIVTKSQVSQNIVSREPTISIRLTRLLRTIQKFQDKLLQE